MTAHSDRADWLLSLPFWLPCIVVTLICRCRSLRAQQREREAL
jgi:hypothetical protein